MSVKAKCNLEHYNKWSKLCWRIMTLTYFKATARKCWEESFIIQRLSIKTSPIEKQTQRLLWQRDFSRCVNMLKFFQKFDYQRQEPLQDFLFVILNITLRLFEHRSINKLFGELFINLWNWKYGWLRSQVRKLVNIYSPCLQIRLKYVVYNILLAGSCIEQSQAKIV